MDADPGPDPAELFGDILFAADLGIELTRAADGHAEGRLELAERHSSNERTGVVHGGVTYSLVDTDGSGTPVAECRGVYKTGGGDDGSAWGERPGA